MNLQNIIIPDKKRMAPHDKIEFLRQFGKIEITNTNIKYTLDPEYADLDFFNSVNQNITQRGGIKYFVNLVYHIILDIVKHELELKEKK